MTKPEALPAENMNARYATLTLTLSLAISGCTQAPQWLSDNKLQDAHASAEHAPGDFESDSPEFDVSETENKTKRAKMLLTNFNQPATSSEQRPADEAATQTLALDSHKTRTEQMPMPHKSDGVLPKKNLTTLAKGETLDTKLKQAPGIVIVDFFADWCGPCRRQASILHSMESKAAENNAKIIKVNIEQHPQLAKKYKVSSLPTLIVIKQGTEISRQIGLANQAKIESLMQL